MPVKKILNFINYRMRVKIMAVNALFLFFLAVLILISFITINKINEINKHRLILAEIEKNASEILLYENEYIDDFSEYYLSRYTMVINNIAVKFEEIKKYYPELEGEIDFINSYTNEHMISFFSISDSVRENMEKGYSSKELAHILEQSKLDISERHGDFYNALVETNKKISSIMDQSIQFVRTALIFTFIFILVLVFIILYISNIIANKGIVMPIVDLSNKMNLFGVHPTEKIIEKTERADEIGDLVNMFSYMAEAIVDFKDNLENKVIERTHDLLVAKEELEIMNTALLKARDALWGEMQLAKRIQFELLPENPGIPGYEISTFIKPADEVGGDYYDIINANEKNWIIIGDVAGHGVAAGLIMMMTQTSVHLMINEHPGISPSKLLTAINHAITYNIKKFKEDKYITMTAISGDKKGNFKFAGLHQDILLYRNKKRIVESVQTSGALVGIYDKLTDEFTDNDFKMEIGDVLLIYTDGITEAWLKGSEKDARDPESDMFGVERLKKILQHTGNLSTNEIREEILFRLGNYDADDDITIVIVKRVE